jgi:cytosine/uracil/thiamine/allantoin permease
LYDYSWFVGFTVSFVAYYALMKLRGEPAIGVPERMS